MKKAFMKTVFVGKKVVKEENNDFLQDGEWGGVGGSFGNISKHNGADCVWHGCGSEAVV